MFCQLVPVPVASIMQVYGPAPLKAKLVTDTLRLWLGPKGCGTGLLSVDLMNGHLNRATLGNLGKGTTHGAHDGLGTGLNVVVTTLIEVG